jgi:hypothetical protein
MPRHHINKHRGVSRGTPGRRGCAAPQSLLPELLHKAIVEIVHDDFCKVGLGKRIIINIRMFLME